VAGAIKDAMRKYRDNQIPANHIEEFLAHYTRENLTQKLMHIVEERLMQRIKK
jgi:hypothetical protein